MQKGANVPDVKSRTAIRLAICILWNGPFAGEYGRDFGLAYHVLT